ncbi:MAG: LL-diaminopimelate aminotransferase [Elusimicrobia bacterium RIFOXYA2_FULL_50_26]|nr:MAG: LL-diaminopimelate aminotransferase [Elusimicrobia bacterium RIFOXYA2_FULL_50_26]OGS23461.1 MAG: LL-diaminopimelate aminotransferase [Elusimicrobia bacterium RIFOXYB2_FULL_50_12]
MDKIKPSKKLNALPPYLFARINALKMDAYDNKLDVIDLGMGNPDLPAPSHVVERVCDTVRNHPRTHRYPQAKGMPRFRRAAASWMKERFGVSVNPDTEVLALIGSKEGIAHLCMSYLDPGDVVLVCDPAYPVHFNGVVLAGGTVYSLPLLAENNFLPDLTKIPEDVARKAKMFFLNYPNNPTSAVVEDRAFLKEVVAFAKKYEILVIYDNAYSEITFDGYVAPSFFEIEGGWDVGLEFHSLSKTYNMAGWRIGWAAGKKELLYPLEKFKSFLDYGAPTFIQLGAAAALEGSQECVRAQVEIYQKRRDLMVRGLEKIGWHVDKPKATMYLWLKIPDQFAAMGSLAFAEKLLKDTGVCVAPGAGFGACGEGYIRMALVTHDNRFHDVLLRLKKIMREEK